MNLEFYIAPENQSAIFRAIPICRLNEVKEILKQAGVRYHVRYRGPRKNDRRIYTYDKQAGCLRENATHFSVYSSEDILYFGYDIKVEALRKLGLV